MCVILDTNAIGDVFSDPAPDRYAPLIRWLFRGDGVVVAGGRVLREITRNERAASRLRELQRTNRCVILRDAAIDAESRRLAGLVCSNDAHVVALAIVSGARLLVSEDEALRSDFCSARIVTRPRGKVYSSADHAHLLIHTTSCRRGRSARSGVRRVRRGRRGGDRDE